jgi:hypothetical protein
VKNVRRKKFLFPTYLCPQKCPKYGCATLSKAERFYKDEPGLGGFGWVMVLKFVSSLDALWLLFFLFLHFLFLPSA